jgi:hypothetical protein
MTDTMTSQNIDLSSWYTLYIYRPVTKFKGTFIAKYNSDKEIQWYENPPLPSECRKGLSGEQLIHEIPLSNMSTLHNEKRPRVLRTSNKHKYEENT